MSPRLPALKPREVIRALERAGFFLHHSTGSHHYYKHREKPARLVTVPVHPGDLKRRVIASIIKQSGLTTEEFLKFL